MSIYQPTDSEIAGVSKKLGTALGALYGFPTGDALDYFSRRLLQIVRCQKTSEILDAYRMGFPELKGQPHAILGDVMDIDWLIGEIADRSEKFPPLIAWRRLYCEFLPPRDGRSPEEMAI